MISIFVPVYNEEKIIKKNILKIEEAAKKTGDAFEIVIVDDSSTDDTKKIAEMLSKKKEIRTIRYKDGPSRRENLAKSFGSAEGDIICYIDIDLATDLKYLPKLIKNIKKGYDVSIGSRYKGKRPRRNMNRLIISKIYNFCWKVIFKSKIKDHQCGFKAFRKEKILKIIDEMGHDEKRGWFWDSEVLIRAQRKNYKIYEFPVEWRRGEKSSFNIRRETRMIPYVFRMAIKR